MTFMANLKSDDNVKKLEMYHLTRLSVLGLRTYFVQEPFSRKLKLWI